MARLCEAAWHGEMPGKESAVAKTMPFVLMTALRRAAAPHPAARRLNRSRLTLHVSAAQHGQGG